MCLRLMCTCTATLWSLNRIIQSQSATADVVQRLLQQTSLRLKATHGGSAAAQRRSVSPVSILNLSLTFTARWGSAEVHLQLETQSSGTHRITAQTPPAPHIRTLGEAAPNKGLGSEPRPVPQSPSPTVPRKEAD